MCTLIVLHRCVPGSPLVIAANRDEFLDRPAEGPAVRKRASGSILAPLDLEAGGTWLGVNDRGVFVGLTNLRPAAADAAGLEHAGKRTRDATHASGVASASRILDAGQGMGISGAASRGDVVMAALDAASAVDAVERVARMTRRDAPGNARGETAKYNPFQLLIADAERAWLTVYRDHRAATRTTELEPGVHVVGNVESPRGEGFRIDSPAEVARFDRTAAELPRVKKIARIEERAQKILTERSPDLFEDLAEICREHVETEPFESTCVHVADRYGTRSSFLLELHETNEPATSTARRNGRLWLCDGAPCQSEFEDRSDLLDALHAESA